MGKEKFSSMAFRLPPESENDESTPASTQHFEFPDTLDSKPIRQRSNQPQVGNHC